LEGVALALRATEHIERKVEKENVALAPLTRARIFGFKLPLFLLPNRFKFTIIILKG